MFAWACSAAALSTVPGLPRNAPIHGDPNPIRKAHRTQAMSTRQKVLNTISMVLTAHFRCTRPPYRTARAGMLMRPTRVAAVICHALSPELSHDAYGFTASFLRGACSEGGRSQHRDPGCPG